MAAESVFLGEGSTFGRFRLGRMLGRGTSGTVFQAVDTSSGALCALKLLAPALADAAAEGLRFDAEVMARHRIDHPDIQRLLDAGRQGAQRWLALEWVPGVELTRYTRPALLLPPPLVVRTGARLAHALAHAHARGVLHRDLKPDNVLVNLPQDIVKLTDFGTARLEDDVAQRTRSGELLGSPAYMAPELLAGAAADARSDVYALGAMLFELLAGRRPHLGDTLGELLGRIAREPVPDLAALRADLPHGLAAVVARALARDPQARHAGAAELAGELTLTLGPAPERAVGT